MDLVKGWLKVRKGSEGVQSYRSGNVRGIKVKY